MPGLFDLKEGGWELKGLIASFILVFIGGGLTIYNQLAGGHAEVWNPIPLV